eukprot:jgi/Mesvir1/21988/Mv04524-RA.1
MPLKTIGSKAQVHKGIANETETGLTKDKITQNDRTGQYVLKVRSELGKEAQGHVEDWREMLKRMYAEANPDSFVKVPDPSKPWGFRYEKNDVKANVPYKSILKKASQWTLEQLERDGKEPTTENKKKLWAAYLNGEIPPVKFD